MSILEAANAYVAETAPMKNGASPLEVMLRRAFMAGALEAARHDRTDILRDCLDFARTIGTPAERAAR